MAEVGESKAACRSATGNALLQTAILSAMADIESLLQNEPEFVGESRDAEERLLNVEPLSIVYKIDYRSRIVDILRVKMRRSEN
jgi:hypothetical protein